MSLRNDDPDEERQANQSLPHRSIEQVTVLAAAQQPEAAADSHSVLSLDNDNNNDSVAVTLGSAPDLSTTASLADEPDATAAENLPLEDGQPSASAATGVSDVSDGAASMDAPPQRSDASEASAAFGAELDADGRGGEEVDSSARDSVHDAPDSSANLVPAADNSGAVAATEGRLAESHEGAAVLTAPDAAAAADTSSSTDLPLSDTGHATATSSATSIEADRSTSLHDESQEEGQQRAAAELDVDSTVLPTSAPASVNADDGAPSSLDTGVALEQATAADQSED
jgi:hypothetical protein